jgi:hypothetical protein
VVAVGAAAADAVVEAAPASSTVMQKRRRIGLGSVRTIIGRSPVFLSQDNAARGALGEIGSCYGIDARDAWERDLACGPNRQLVRPLARMRAHELGTYDED